MELPDEFISLWKGDIRPVKELYADRKYRKCAIYCSEALKRTGHPLLRSFLFFYQAICFESLGHISHDRSNNKIPLLEQARDAFITANEIFTDLVGTHGRYGVLQSSPIGELLSLYQDTPSRAPVVEVENENQQDASVMSRPGLTIAHIAPSLIDDESQTDETDLQNSGTIGALGTRKTKKAMAKARLSRSLSSQHALAEKLVPSPLFSRTASTKNEFQIYEDPEVTLLPLVSLSKPLPPIPNTLRPLPLLPFNTNVEFLLKGKRLVVVPKRKTALATLISKFEPENPFNSPGTIVSFTHTAKTPVTERFENIAAAFVDKDDEKENMELLPDDDGNYQKLYSAPQSRPIDPFTPCPAPRPQKCISTSDITDQDTPNSQTSSDLAKPLPDLVVTVRSSLLKHITTVNKKIEQVRDLQKSHQDEKRRQFATMHSRDWSLVPESPSKNKNRQSRISPAKDTRLRSFWNLQIADVQSRSTSAHDEKKKALKERIERLKKNGWQDVRKEAKGFKGAAYYEALRSSVEQEMAAYV